MSTHYLRDVDVRIDVESKTVSILVEYADLELKLNVSDIDESLIEKFKHDRIERESFLDEMLKEKQETQNIIQEGAEYD
ncbi:MAG: hypothetical protein ABIK73_06055 [candidate division WOR-3 bacterium]